MSKVKGSFREPLPCWVVRSFHERKNVSAEGDILVNEAWPRFFRSIDSNEQRFQRWVLVLHSMIA